MTRLFERHDSPASDPSPRPTSSLEMRYRLTGLLGEGAAARVYSACDTIFDIDVAVKMMRTRHTRSTSLRQRFAEEARLTARAMNPHVVKILGRAVTNDGLPCIVYERLVGETLASRLERECALSLEETGEIITQVARGLSQAHSLEILHRDVKPSNIFLIKTPSGATQVKLLDFGVATEVARSVSATNNDLVGTPEYIPPEVMFNTQAPDPRGDLYALGVVAFECLTGRCPYPGQTMNDVLVLLSRGDRSSVRDARPDLHENVEEWIDRAIHPDPFWRFASAKDLVDALDVALADIKAKRTRKAA